MTEDRVPYGNQQLVPAGRNDLFPIGGGRGLSMQTMAIAERLGDLMLRTGLFADTQDAAQATFKIISGMTFGWSPAYSMENIYIIRAGTDDKGREYPPGLALSAKSMAGLVRQSDRYEYRIIRLDDTGCSIEFRRDGKAEYVSHWTIEDAKRVGLWDRGKKMYQKYPRAMYFSGAMRSGVKAACGDLLQGSGMRNVLLDELPQEYIDAEIIDGAQDETGEAAETDALQAMALALDSAEGEPEATPQPVTNGNGAEPQPVVARTFQPDGVADRPWDAATLLDVKEQYRRWITSHRTLGQKAQAKVDPKERQWAVILLSDVAGKRGDEFRYTVARHLFGDRFASTGAWWGWQASFVIWWLRRRGEGDIASASDEGKMECEAVYRAALVGEGQKTLL